MPVRLTKRLRRWGTAMLAASYVFGLLGPAIAFAQADRAAILHVLDEAHGGTLTLHFHGDHERPGPSGKPGSKNGSKPVHHCCGVISLPGLEPDAGLALVAPVLSRTGFAAAPPALPGRGTGRLDRPPRHLLPV